MSALLNGNAMRQPPLLVALRKVVFREERRIAFHFGVFAVELRLSLCYAPASVDFSACLSTSCVASSDRSGG